MDERVMREIEDDRLTTEIKAELWHLSRLGLLEFSVTEHGDGYFWPTPRGCIELGMEMDDTSGIGVLA